MNTTLKLVAALSAGAAAGALGLLAASWAGVGVTPAKVRRELTEQEVAWKLDGTRTYQDLTRRSLASWVEVAPLTAVEADRPKVQAPHVEPLVALKRQ